MDSNGGDKITTASFKLQIMGAVETRQQVSSNGSEKGSKFQVMGAKRAASFK